MLQRLIDKMIEREIEQKIIKPEEVSIYKYGYILVYEVVLNIILSVLIGILFDSIVNVLFFLVVFIPIRSFCGGWHADTIWKCTVVSNIILVLEIIYVEYVIKHINIWILYPIFVLFLIYIIYVAPVETRTKRISQNEKEVYRKKIYVIITMHIIVTIILMIFHIKKYVFVILYAYFIQVLFLLLEKRFMKNN